MKKKIMLSIPFIITIWIASFFYSKWLFLAITLVCFLCFVALVLFVILNRLVRSTNWFKNPYKFTTQFISNTGYRDNIIRNYDIINLGSNPAAFGFFYEGIKGQSWATGSQGLDMDFEILKYYHSYLKQGGTVLIPIMPFTAISPYIKTKNGYWDLRYYSKFYKILDFSQKKNLPYFADITRYLRFPLLYYRTAFKYILKDVQMDDKYSLAEQPMMSIELMHDAEQWMKLWYKEFDIKNINDVCDSRWDKWVQEASEIIEKMIVFCLERELRPVLIYLPSTIYLSRKFTKQAKDRLLYDFVNKINKYNIEFLDYSTNVELQDESLYYNSFFLNMRGRKIFTNKVLSDLKLK